MIAKPRARPPGALSTAQANSLIQSLYSRSPVELAAATRLVQAFELMADEWDGPTPLWRGWSIHQAFLLGIRWARAHAEEKEK